MTGAGDAALFAFADVFGIGGGGARREPLGWTASAADLSGENGSLDLEAYVICATVAG